MGAVMAGVLEQITTHADDAADRLIERFRKKDRFIGRARLNGDQAQAIEDAAWDVLRKRFFPLDGVAEGASNSGLDLLGKLLVRPRDGLSDEIYLKVLQAITRARRSKGDEESILLPLATVWSGLIEIIPAYPAKQYVNIYGGAVSDALLGVIKDLLRKAKAAGVGTVVTWSPDTPDRTLHFESPLFLASPASGGSSNTPALTGTMTAGFGYIALLNTQPLHWPASGSCKVAAGTGTEETLHYTQFYLDPVGGVWRFEFNPVPSITQTAGKTFTLLDPPTNGDLTITLTTSPDPATYPNGSTLILDEGLTAEDSRVIASIAGPVVTLTTRLQHDHGTGAVVRAPADPAHFNSLGSSDPGYDPTDTQGGILAGAATV